MQKHRESLALANTAGFEAMLRDYEGQLFENDLTCGQIRQVSKVFADGCYFRRFLCKIQP